MVRMFATPLEEDHKKPQSVLLEGKYWKRRLGAIVEEYKKWRKFFRPVRDAPLSEEDVLHVVNGATSSSQNWNGLGKLDRIAGIILSSKRFCLLNNSII